MFPVCFVNHLNSLYLYTYSPLEGVWDRDPTLVAGQLLVSPAGGGQGVVITVRRYPSNFGSVTRLINNP
jgi:hypothetical protein